MLECVKRSEEEEVWIGDQAFRTLRFVSISFPPATFPRDIPQTGAPPAVYGHGTRLLTVTPAALRTAGGRGELDADASRPGTGET